MSKGGSLGVTAPGYHFDAGSLSVTEVYWNADCACSYGMAVSCCQESTQLQAGRQVTNGHSEYCKCIVHLEYHGRKNAMRAGSGDLSAALAKVHMYLHCPLPQTGLWFGKVGFSQKYILVPCSNSPNLGFKKCLGKGIVFYFHLGDLASGILSATKL